MFEFIFLLIATLFFSYICKKQQYTEGCKRLFIVFIYILASLYTGLRFRVGIDTLNYMDGYKYLMLNDIRVIDLFSSEQPYQPLYMLLIYIAKAISTDLWALQLLHSLVLNALIFTFIYKNTKSPFLGIFIYLITYYLYFNTEIMRESLAVGVFLCFTESLYNKKWLTYYTGVIIAMLFHISAAILLFFPLVQWLKPNKQFIIIVILSILMLGMAKSFLQDYLPLLNGQDNDTMRKMNGYVEFANDGWSLFGILYELSRASLIPIMFLYVYTEKKGRTFRYHNMILLTIIISIGIVFLQIIFSRFINYIMPFIALLYTDFIADYFKTKQYHKLSLLCIGCFTLLTIYSYTRNSAGYKAYKMWFPYHSVITPLTDSEREEMRNRTF